MFRYPRRQIDGLTPDEKAPGGKEEGPEEGFGKKEKGKLHALQHDQQECFWRYRKLGFRPADRTHSRGSGLRTHKGEEEMNPAEDTIDPEWTRRHDLLYVVELSNLYHRKRERFYDKWDRIGKAVAIAGGSFAIAKISHDLVLQLLGALIAATSAFSLVWSLAERARKHAELARQFCELGAEIARSGEVAFTESQLNEWESKLRMLESTEPASLRALVLVCQNQLATSRRAPIYPLSRFKRFTAQIVDWDVTLPARPTSVAV